jgi:hypothetical protein
MTEQTKYDFERLDKYCKENNVTLLEDYSCKEINCRTFIKSKCLNDNCKYIVDKQFVSFEKKGSYCRNCSFINKKKENNPEFLIKYSFDCLQNYCKENNLDLTKDYSLIKLNQKSRIIGKCLTDNCKKTFDKSFVNLYKRNGYCDLCTTNIKVKKQKQTFITNYGVENPNKLKEFRDKISATNLLKYGCNYTFQSSEIQQKIKNTCLDKYGVENPNQNKTIREKTKKTCLKKYGVNSVLCDENIKNKIKKTCLDKYGVEFPSQNKTIREKIKNTNLKIWGFENVTQNPIIAEKASNNSYQTKIYNLPSGKTIKYQGYENYALDELINLKIDENDIFNKKVDVPEIWFFDKNGLKHRHYVDIYIKSQNKCIEVKSEWYYNITKDTILKKQNAAKELGYNYEVWVYDKKGKKINCI